MVAPVVLTLAITAVVPVAFTLYLSVTRSVDGSYLNRAFAGVGRYGDLVRDGEFWNALWIEAVFVVASLVIEVLLGLLISLALNRGSRLARSARGLMLSPAVLPTIVVALLANYLLRANSGVISHTLGAFGLEQAWLDGPHSALMVLIGIDVWQYTPFVAVLLLAGLQAIPTELTEAARVDGATAWQIFHRITLPLLMPILVTVSLLRMIDAVQVFPTIYVLTGGGPGTSTNALNFWGYTVFFQNRDDQYGAIISAVISAMTLALALIVARVAFNQSTQLRDTQ